MINKLICLYLDFQIVSKEVENIINVKRYGDILFKKKKLKEYHKELYVKAEVRDFVHVLSIGQLIDLVHELRHDTSTYVVLHHSAFAVTIPSEFLLFMQKVKYLDTCLAVSDFDSQKPFLLLDCQTAIPLLEEMAKNSERSDLILEEKTGLEQFKLEKWYKTIRTAVDFIEFLHTNFEARFFNSIEKDTLYITKRSDNIKKIEVEHLYYDFLPDQLKAFFLRPFQLEKTEEWASYKLEKLNIPDVSIQWVHNSFSENEFKILLEKLFLFVRMRPLKQVSEASQTEVTEKFYVKKVKDRLEDLKKMPEYGPIADIIRNSTPFASIDTIFEWYQKEFYAIVKKKNYTPTLALSHGDLCLSNMLYDKRISMLKLIDPRGAETADGLFFDSYYDVCKLSHSVLGDYDLINNGLFELVYDNAMNIKLTTDTLPNKKGLQSLFKLYLENQGFDYELVRIFEASLFISMLPLHIDNPKKVLGFVLNAIKILEHISQK
jgi:hypothetical protein